MTPTITEVRTMIDHAAGPLLRENATLRGQLGISSQEDLMRLAKGLDKQREEIYEGLADVFVGPKLTKGSTDEEKRQLRKQSRRAFAEGRA